MAAHDRRRRRALVRAIASVVAAIAAGACGGGRHAVHAATVRALAQTLHARGLGCSRVTRVTAFRPVVKGVRVDVASCDGPDGALDRNDLLVLFVYGSVAERERAEAAVTTSTAATGLAGCVNDLVSGDRWSVVVGAVPRSRQTVLQQRVAEALGGSARTAPC